MSARGGHISLRCCVSVSPTLTMRSRCCSADSARSHSHTMQPRAAHTCAAARRGCGERSRGPARPGRLVTGGSKAPDAPLSQELLAHGCTVITCARDITPLVELSAAQPRCRICADVSTAEGRSPLLSTVDRQFSAELDILANNVGTNLQGVHRLHRGRVRGSQCDQPVLRLPLEPYAPPSADEHASVPSGRACITPVHASRLAGMCYAAFAQRRRGCVINVSVRPVRRPITQERRTR